MVKWLGLWPHFFGLDIKTWKDKRTLNKLTEKQQKCESEIG